ncbi:3',5'-cyclic AMP phosphodiesterase CpdA [Agromyces sp. CF514]|uniref:phosphodiesterase n=1 Tax=Agromyces sp. CF514 TaxID=1881031 RepID=UPI0008E8027F|nr:phosphodiesterase [Agromyces sp. CF514]SFR75579.1 3',5'-cyclic AMP phosphodiesterase CpdA [Agromyces sp. CF514]
MAVQLGTYPAATHVIAHLSDTHFLDGGAPLGGRVDTVGALAQAAAHLEHLGSALDAIVVTGDVADIGEPDAYRRVRAVLEPLAAAADASLVWVMGNHDERDAFRVGLLDQDPAADAPVNHVTEVGGVRLIALDSSVPGYHHGALEPETLEWLDAQLSDPAPQGTVVALHHAPIPTPIALMDVLELRRQHEFADVIRGRDVRLILGGHLHYPTNGSFAGIPVSVAGATAYTMDVSAPARALVGVDGGRSFNLVHLFEGHVVTSVVPIGRHARVAGFEADFLDEIESLSPADRVERFSRKRPA